MKNIFLLVVIIFSLVQSSTGQNCKDCIPTATYATKTIPVCDFNSGTQNRPMWMPPLPNGAQQYYSDVIAGPCVFVIVDYAVVSCGGFSSLFIKDAVYVDNTNYWKNIDAHLPGNSCPYINTIACNRGGIREEIMKAIAKVITTTSLSGNPINTVYFKSSCSALAKIKWPDGAFLEQGGGDGQPTQQIQLTNSTYYTMIPCNSQGCCKVSYKYVPIVLENGHTVDRYVIADYSFEGECGGGPDLGEWKAPTASVIDPNTGLITTVNGEIDEMEECKPMCNTGDAPPIPLVRTDVTEVAKTSVKLELAAIPTQFNNYIKFISTTPIQKIAVYDASGRKISGSSYSFEDNELKTNDLKSGIYYIQAQFSGNITRTIKVIKD